MDVNIKYYNCPVCKVADILTMLVTSLILFRLIHSSVITKIHIINQSIKIFKKIYMWGKIRSIILPSFRDLRICVASECHLVWRKETGIDGVMYNNAFFQFFNIKEFHKMMVPNKIKIPIFQSYVRLYYWLFKILKRLNYCVTSSGWNKHTHLMFSLFPPLTFEVGIVARSQWLCQWCWKLCWDLNGITHLAKFWLNVGKWRAHQYSIHLMYEKYCNWQI
jgi:hypothetical protein